MLLVKDECNPTCDYTCRAHGSRPRLRVRALGVAIAACSVEPSPLHGVASVCALLALAGAGARSAGGAAAVAAANAAEPAPPSRAGDAAPPRSPRNASYTITRPPRSASRTLTGDELLTWRNTSTHPATTSASTSTTTRGGTPRSTWMRERALAGDADARRTSRGRLGLDRRHQPAARSAPSGAPIDLTSRHALHRARRRQRRRPTVAEVPLDRAGGAGRDGQRADRLVVARAAHLRAHRRDRQLLLPRAVVSEDRRPRGRRLELPPVPRRDRVLLRLRHLRRPADRARTDGSSAPPASSASRRDEGDGTTTHHYYAGGRARLRLDDEPGLCRADRATFEHAAPAAR